MTDRPLPRPRVLVVEDEMLVAMMLEDMLTGLGFEVVGPASRLERAMEMAHAEALDLAVLDVNLVNAQSFPVADLLQAKGVPFIFATGYGSKGMIDRFRQAVTLQKPFELDQLEAAISTVLVTG